MPTYAQNGLIGLTTRHLLAAAVGGIVLVGWAVLLAAIGVALTARRDVT